MASRGRGRGRGAKRTFNKEQLNALGAVGNETFSQHSTPPPLFVPLQRTCAPLESSPSSDHALVLKQAFVNFLQLSFSYMKLPGQSDGDQEKISLPGKEIIYDWAMFPPELRPKLKAKRKARIVTNEKSIIEKLKILEEMENKSSYAVNRVKTEPTNDEDEELMEEEEQMDDEIDDGTDYGNNYFDNGDSYCNDEDDNLDDGPVY